MTAALIKTSDRIDALLATGDVGRLSPEERVEYYQRLCESLSLNPLTRPFEFLTLQGKTVLYAKKDATDQLRKSNGVSITVLERATVDGVLTVTVRATTRDGRSDEDCGAVVVGNLRGEALANAHMKALTKAKRRVTLSICGLGILDESELDTVRGAVPLDAVPTPVLAEATTPATVRPGAEERRRRFDQARQQEHAPTQLEPEVELARPSAPSPLDALLERMATAGPDDVSGILSDIQGAPVLKANQAVRAAYGAMVQRLRAEQQREAG